MARARSASTCGFSDWEQFVPLGGGGAVRRERIERDTLTGFKGSRATSRRGVKAATARRIGSRLMPSGSFQSRRGGPTSPWPSDGTFLA
jgi:hypothetical protein